MRTALIVFALAFLVIPTFAYAADGTEQAMSHGAAADGKLTDAQRAEMVSALEASQTHTLSMVAGLSDEALNWKSAEDRWSVAQVLEHLMLAENVFHMQMKGAMEQPADPEWQTKVKGRTEQLSQTIPDRSNPVQAPDALAPKGETSRADMVATYVAKRAETIEVVRTSQEPLNAHVMESNFFGHVNASHWLLFAALHNQRHNKQIQEILDDPNFPG